MGYQTARRRAALSSDSNCDDVQRWGTNLPAAAPPEAAARAPRGMFGRAGGAPLAGGFFEPSAYATCAPPLVITDEVQRWGANEAAANR